MKAVILAGGLPSAISDDFEGIPKPMAEIGDRPILWHIMQLYSHYGIQDFVICAGYKSDLIKRYFIDYYIYQSDITIDLNSNDIEIHKKKTENWNVVVLDTGLRTSICERLRQAKPYITENEFLLSYGDCISDLDINELLKTHHIYKKCATVAVARPAGRNKVLSLNGNGELLSHFSKEDAYMSCDAWVNACSMVFSNEIFNYLNIGIESIETDLFNKLIMDKQIGTYKHSGFWSPVETKRDKAELEKLWRGGQAPWIVWDKGDYDE